MSPNDLKTDSSMNGFQQIEAIGHEMALSWVKFTDFGNLGP